MPSSSSGARRRQIVDAFLAVRATAAQAMDSITGRGGDASTGSTHSDAFRLASDLRRSSQGKEEKDGGPPAPAGGRVRPPWAPGPPPARPAAPRGRRASIASGARRARSAAPPQRPAAPRTHPLPPASSHRRS
ncbi:unnamed protein product [Prorocentrum cordatum]|uniref:Uncharacterized protein n=1 Tax=Prorocentrum cordatum TaxID=2364126 RepID=A0ABN9U756_9DINO|nr:unnamed protein product [Polarella glacialis]